MNGMGKVQIWLCGKSIWQQILTDVSMTQIQLQNLTVPRIYRDQNCEGIWRGEGKDQQLVKRQYPSLEVFHTGKVSHV